MFRLTEEQLAFLDNLLNRREVELRTELREEAARSAEERYVDVAGSVADSGDEAVADLLTDIDNAAANRDLDELRDVEAARGRMSRGTYGICADCAEWIAYPRLAAYPTATRCARCQEHHERTSPEPRLSSL